MILQTYTISVDLPDDAAITHATHHFGKVPSHVHI